MKLKKPKKKVIFIIAGLVLVVGVGGFALSQKARMNRISAVSVSEASATLGTVSSTITGSGNISMSNTVSISVPTGILVKEVCVEAGDTVKKGTVLAKLDKVSIASQIVDAQDALDDVNDKLDDDDDLSDYEIEELKGQKKEIKAWIKELKALHESPQIVSTKAGIVGTISISDGETTSKSTGSSGSSNYTSSSASSLYTSANSGSSVIKASTENSTTVSAVKTSMDTGSERSSKALTASNAVASSADGQAKNASTLKISQSSDKAVLLSSVAEESELDTTITDFSSLSLTAPVTGQTPQSDISGSSAYDASISWDCSDSFAAGNAYTATITLTAKSGYVFSGSSLPSISGAETSIDVSSDGSKMTIKATFAKTTEATTESSSEDTTASTESSQDSNASQSTQASQNTTAAKQNTAQSGSASPSMGSGSGGISVSGGSSSGSASASTSASGSSTYTYGSYECEAFTIQLQDEATVVINVDELDILSIEEGQSATVTLDALEDQELEGEITKISSVANTGSNSVTYPVTITLPKEDSLMDGMSATAVITISKSENVVTIPVLALQEKGDEVYVYTQKSEDGTLSGEISVETGLSDGSNVEITSGLSEGDTVYYVRVGNDSSDFSNMMNGGGFGHGNEGGERPSGDMPSGGGMPSGGNGGGPQ